MIEKTRESHESAHPTRIEREMAAFRELRESGTSDAERALSTAIERVAADLASRTLPRGEADSGPSIEEQTTPVVEYVRRERARRA